MKLILILLLVSICYGGLDTNYVYTYKIYIEHELVYEVDTVECTFMYPTGKSWYLKGEIDRWSDKHPILLKKRKRK